MLTFERLVREGTADALARAAALYRGDLLDGIAVHDPSFEDWLSVERQRLRQLFERALTGLMAQALADADADTAADAARRLLLLDPLNEAAYRSLMQIHADQAQTAQALRLYESLRERLYRELGVQPEPATIALHDRIQQRRTTTAAVAAAPTEVARSAPEASPPHPEEPQPAKPSVAVLPLVNLSAIRSSSTSATASPRTSSRSCRASGRCSSSPAIRPFDIGAAAPTLPASGTSSVSAIWSRAACAASAIAYGRALS